MQPIFSLLLILLQQDRQLMHLAGSTLIDSFSKYSAPSGHITVHRPQPIQFKVFSSSNLICFGCGLCTVICPEGALYLEKESIEVDQSRCVSCLSCCRKINNKLKMGCIARNYKINRLCISLI